MAANRPSSRLPMLLFSIVLGLSVVAAVRAQSKVDQQATAGRVTEEFVRHLIAVTDEKEQIRTEIGSLQAALAQQGAAGPTEDELTKEQAFAGLTELRGPGVLVTLSDPGGGTSVTRQVGVSDVLVILNELRAGGAEAIAVNGIRITARTSVSQPKSPGPIAIGGIYLEGPIRIVAVGDSAILYASLLLRGGVVEQLTPWMTIDVAKAPDVVVPALGSLAEFRFAVPQK